MLAFLQSDHIQGYSQPQQMLLSSGAAGRLLVAAALGCAVGIDREYRHRPSGIRTNVLICFGAAMFTFLSGVIAGDGSANKAQIASNIVQGIGFLGAGLILHNRHRVSGLTSAATVWAVASIGMACGAGLYFPAIFATVIVILVLELIRQLEYRANLKLYSVTYEARGSDAGAMTMGILEVMDREHRPMGTLQSQPVGNIERLCFSVSATDRAHRRLLNELRSAPGIGAVCTFRDMEDD